MNENIRGLVVDHRIPLFNRRGVIVFIHGMWGNAKYFENWAEYSVEEGFEIYSVNLQGHGGSRTRKPSLNEVSIFDYVADVRRIIEHIGNCKNLFLVGHSMGGLIAQKLASEGLCEKVAFVASAPPRFIPVIGPILWKIPKYLHNIALLQAFVPSTEDIFDLILNNIEEEKRDQYLDHFGSESAKVAIQVACGAIAVRNILVPSLVVGGTKDKMTPALVQQAIRKKYGSDYVEFNCGHMPMIESNWHVPIEYILKWLDAS